MWYLYNPYQSFLASPELDGLVGLDDGGTNRLFHNHLLTRNVGAYVVCACVYVAYKELKLYPGKFGAQLE